MTNPQTTKPRTIAEAIKQRLPMTVEEMREEIVRALYFRLDGRQIKVPDGLLLNILHYLGAPYDKAV